MSRSSSLLEMVVPMNRGMSLMSIASKLDLTADFEMAPLNPAVPPLYSSINSNATTTEPYISEADEGTEFFPVINEEIDRINTFFVGKLADLQSRLEEITEKRQNTYRSHHSGSAELSNPTKLRSIYIELTALIGYAALNKTGFKKM